MHTTFQRALLILAGILFGIVLYVLPDMLANPGETVSFKVKALSAIILLVLSIVARRKKDPVITHFTLASGIVLVALLGVGGIIRSNELGSPEMDQAAVSSSSASSSSSVSSDYEYEVAAPVTYVKGICNADIPSTWHVRSAADQAVWNTEGIVAPGGTLTADYIFMRLKEGLVTKFKPAFYSLAESGTLLPGHMDDPEAEDSNRLEIDILRLEEEELQKLGKLLGNMGETSTIDPYEWKYLPSRDWQRPTLVDSSEGQKYSGQEFVFFPADAAHGEYAFIIVNRSTDYPTAKSFRESFHRFIETIDFSEVPEKWLRERDYTRPEQSP